MFDRGPLILLAAFAAAPAFAREPSLQTPIECDLGSVCHIQQYVDTDPGPGVADFTCGPLSYNAHKGTDFALPSLAMMEAGVAVRPAAPGSVVNIRDGMVDIAVGSPGAPPLEGRDCGNGVVIDHGGGWVTQYCHLKNGTIAVQPGQRVTMATKLGDVGLSGATAFPHIHLSVRHRDKVVDPFNPSGIVACNSSPVRTLWSEPISYAPGGLIAAGFADQVPDYDRIKAGDAAQETLPNNAPALVVWGYAFGGQEGDILRIRIDGPDGQVITEDVVLEKTQAQLFRAIGRKAPPEGWSEGTYNGTLALIRGGETIDNHETQVVISAP